MKRKIQIIMKVLRRKAKIIHDLGGDYFSLICFENEFGQEDYYPLPLLPKLIRGIAKAVLHLKGTRGADFWFRCPFCGMKSFYGIRDADCISCGEYIPTSQEVTWESIRASDAKEVAISLRWHSSTNCLRTLRRRGMTIFPLSSQEEAEELVELEQL